MEEKLSTQRKEVEHIKASRRDLNIVIFRMSIKDLKTEARVHEKDILKELLEACDVEEELESIAEVTRLGDKKPGKQRPLMVTFEEIYVKKHLFSNLRNLKDACDEIRK